MYVYVDFCIPLELKKLCAYIKLEHIPCYSYKKSIIYNKEMLFSYII